MTKPYSVRCGECPPCRKARAARLGALPCTQRMCEICDERRRVPGLPWCRVCSRRHSMAVEADDRKRGVL